MDSKKPLGHSAYGSIPHLPCSRLGPKDHSVNAGQARICLEQARDKYDRIICQEKLDGSCVAVALLNDQVLALGRAGYLAADSPYVHIRMFADWVAKNESRFRRVLRNGERVVGEWLALSHSTIYYLEYDEPFAAFDIMFGQRRLLFDDFEKRVDSTFSRPFMLHDGGPIGVDAAMRLHAEKHWPCDEIEGVMYRVERCGDVIFLAKFVRLDKIDGKYLPEISGQPPIWNWKPAE